MTTEQGQASRGTVATLPLAGAAQVSLWADGGAAVVRVEAEGRQPLELSIEMGATGPVLKLRTQAIELRADDVAIGCRNFSVRADERMTLTSGGDLINTAAGTHGITAARMALEATAGSVVVRANDDVQLLGEQLLLNCERQPSLPSWLPRVAATSPLAPTLPLSAVSGDASLLDDLRRTESEK